MIEEVKKYKIVCDICSGEYWDMQEDIDYIQEVAEEEGWVKFQKEHYCPKCYTIDEYDDIQINLL